METGDIEYLFKFRFDDLQTCPERLRVAPCSHCEPDIWRRLFMMAEVVFLGGGAKWG